MLKFLLIFFGVIIGVILFLCLCVLYLYIKIRKTFNISKGELRQLIKESEDSKYRVKSISGMSDVLIPKILRDYSSFNETELYNKVESSIRNVFNSLEEQKITNDKELTLIRADLEAQIEDLISTNSKVEFDNVRFHRHALKNYNNRDGHLCIEVETSLEYFYKRYEDGKKVEGKDYKIQNVITTKFVHIYDPDKFEDTNKTHLSAHCPNCGAPLKKFRDNSCSYCGSGVEPINLKSWHLSSYKIKY